MLTTENRDDAELLETFESGSRGGGAFGADSGWEPLVLDVCASEQFGFARVVGGEDACPDREIRVETELVVGRRIGAEAGQVDHFLLGLAECAEPSQNSEWFAHNCSLSEGRHFCRPCVG